MLSFYFFLVFVFLILLIGLSAKKQNKIAIILITLITGLYWGVLYLDTVDMPGYVELYGLLEKGIKPKRVLWGLSYYSFEPAFLYLMQFFKDFNCPFYVFQSCLLLFELSIISISFYKLFDNNKMTTVFLVAISLYIPFWLMAAMRQGIPIAVFIYVLPDIIKGKYIKPVVLISIASLFHSSGVFLLLLILFYVLYKGFILKVDHNLNLLFIFSLLLIFCDLIYIFGLSLAGYLDRITMVLFSDNPFIYRDYTIMSNSERSNFGLLKLVEMNVLYFLTFYVHKNKGQDSFQLFLESMFLIYFVINTVAGGIIVHRLSYFLTIPYYLLFYKELHRLSIRMSFPGGDTILFVMYLFFLFIRQYHPFTTYAFEFFTV